MSIAFEPVATTTTTHRNGEAPLLARTKAKLFGLGSVVFPACGTTPVGVRDDGQVADAGVQETLLSLLRHNIRGRLVA